MLTINDRPVFRLGLEKSQAKLVSSCMDKEYVQQSDNSRIVQRWKHLVELPGRDGQPKRLEILVRDALSFDLPEPGSTVSVVVNKRRTKACFDTDDPAISRSARYDLGAEQRKSEAARAKADFEAKRDQPL